MLSVMKYNGTTSSVILSLFQKCAVCWCLLELYPFFDNAVLAWQADQKTEVLSAEVPPHQRNMHRWEIAKLHWCRGQHGDPGVSCEFPCEYLWKGNAECQKTSAVEEEESRNAWVSQREHKFPQKDASFIFCSLRWMKSWSKNCLLRSSLE